ncbi:uncharacterized protein LOC134824892 isoform X2 [Bolinopsis microptera]|uniref:uncharacterized protein LOC134824892 isoform X2 n=1 Tax=Bolinopsis microptera TaxID=2820187 RepID=UPI003078D271
MWKCAAHSQGCSVKQTSKCACFENTWGCQKVTVTQLQPERFTFEVENGSPASIFDNVMRELHRPSRPQEKETLHTYFCEGTVGTPYVWSLVTSGLTTWSNKKWCFSKENKHELRVKHNMVISVSAFNSALKHAIHNFNLEPEVVYQEEFMDDIISVDITTTSDLAFNKLSDKLKTLFKEVHANYKPYAPSDKFQLQMEEVVMAFENFKCRTYDYRDCLKILKLYQEGSAPKTLFHLSADLQDLFMTVTSTPAVLLVYTPSHYDETQELCVYLDSSLGQSTIGEYSVAMMSETKQYKAGVYYILYPNSIKECKEEVYRCLSKKFGVYLPPAAENAHRAVPVVFGEQFIDEENHHRGNLNKAWFFEPPKELKMIYDIKTLLQASDYEPVLKSDTTSLRVLDESGYYSSISDKRGHFILFVFRSDVSSLYTIKQLLETRLPGILIVECFNLNLVCDKLDIKSYPVVFFARNNETLHYAGPMEEVALNTFRELIEHPVVTRAHRIQVDLVLKGADNKAVVMISSGKSELEDMFHLACDEVYGFIRCYLLDSKNPNENMLIVHVPDDPVMINKKYPLKKEKSVDGLVKKIKKLSTSSVISESELLLVYKDLTDIVLFDQVLDDELAKVVNTFPFVQFVQVSSPEFKHKLLRELVGYDYDEAMLFISKSRKCGYKFPEEATLETWLTGALDGSLSPDFKLKDLEGSKYQYQDIYYKNQFRVFEQSVRSMRKHVDEMNQNLGRYSSEWKSHQEL